MRRWVPVLAAMGHQAGSDHARRGCVPLESGPWHKECSEEWTLAAGKVSSGPAVPPPASGSGSLGRQVGAAGERGPAPPLHSSTKSGPLNAVPTASFALPQKPENALKRAEELVNVGQKGSALQVGCWHWLALGGCCLCPAPGLHGLAGGGDCASASKKVFLPTWACRCSMTPSPTSAPSATGTWRSRP